YILRKYEVTETTNSLSANQSGSDLNLSISGFAGGRFEIINDKLYAAAGKRIDVVDLSTFTITDSIFLAKPVVDATVNGEQLYAAIFNLSEIQNDSQDLVDGGFYLIENGALTDSLIGDYGYRKLLTVGERLFGIRWIGSGKSINPPYNFVSLNTEMVEINGKTETVLFSEPTMASVNDYWVHFQFDEIRERFLLPGSTDYVTSNFYIRDFSGALIKETSHPGQASNVIVLKEVQ
ncbi:MAG: hypothetical protein KDD94_11760, partial [Calditrichaeota bacterium]|nr:hypothetical protein [Calditrichota bacterium]